MPGGVSAAIDALDRAVVPGRPLRLGAALYTACERLGLLYPAEPGEAGGAWFVGVAPVAVCPDLSEWEYRVIATPA